MSRLTRDGTAPNPSRETKFSGTNADREIFIFRVQLTTCRTGNLTRFSHTLAMCLTIHTSIHIIPGTKRSKQKNAGNFILRASNTNSAGGVGEMMLCRESIINFLFCFLSRFSRS